MNIKKAILAGLLFASPYFICNYMVFIFIVPVLALIYSNQKIKNSHIVLFSVFLPCIALLPIITYNIATYFFGILVVAVFLVLFLSITRALVRRSGNPIFSICAPCIVWTSLIYLLNVNSLITSVFEVGVLIPISAPLIWYIGSIGLTTLVILFNSAAARFLVKKDVLSLVVAAALLVMFVGSFIFSGAQNPDNLHASNNPTKIALIQGDVPRGSIFGYEEDLDSRIERYVNLSQTAINEEKPDIVAWPEYTLPIDLANRFPQKMHPILNVARENKTTFIIGSLVSEKSKKNYHYDAALILSGNGDIRDIYYSQDPAIFNENVYPKDNGNKLYLNRMGIALCWEELNANIFRKYAKHGAEYFISLSSNADLDYSLLERYASFFSRARAAENARYLARATQTGVTQIIDPFGRPVKTLPAGRSTFLAGEVYSIGRKTFYSRHGDILTKLFIISAVLGIFITEAIIKGNSAPRSIGHE
ncbi:MAG: hypothetical protein JSV93_03595 [Candidatus Omnitrophota bacterium]|nr:MAG: hypothetical protein JSV93_03595 [Candidatus Omnitrophota bacterium]